jgi:hypothetical protein
MTGLGVVLLGSAAMAAISTLGDFIWATWLPEHRVVYGLIHGTLLFCAIGLFLGTLAARPAAGAAGGAAIGALAAGAFYVLAPTVGYSAMFVVWVGVWMALGLLYARLSGVRPGNPTVLTRGAIAAVASGLAFYLISGIWRPFDPEGWDYAVHLGAWTVAYFPGFAAMLISSRAGRALAARHRGP